MNRTLSPETKEQLTTTGAAISVMPSGIPRTRYYTPDGREEWKIPQHHVRGDGVVYDIFLAQGYTLVPPTNPKLRCSGCDRWHDTQEQVAKCVKERKRFITSMTGKANRELAKEHKEKDKKIEDLEARLKLLEAKLGTQI